MSKPTLTSRADGIPSSAFSILLAPEQFQKLTQARTLTEVAAIIQGVAETLAKEESAEPESDGSPPVAPCRQTTQSPSTFTANESGVGSRLSESDKRYYQACGTCSAKWFARQALRRCPRCGNEPSGLGSAEERDPPLLDPPWKLPPPRASSDDCRRHSDSSDRCDPVPANEALFHAIKPRSNPS